jgi:flagellar hook assembly protein FlgD
MTSTSTVTPTYTATPTVTPTPVPFPFVVQIIIYNSAGEEVKLIADAPASNLAGDINLIFNGVPATVYAPNGGILKIELPGIQTPGQLGGALTTIFDWDGSNTGGQPVQPGDYFIKTSMTDAYGRVITKVQNITVITNDVYTRLSIYNTAGELVKRIQLNSVPSTLISLGIDDVNAVGKGNTGVAIAYAPGQLITWDGTDDEGRTVDSGIYIVKIEISTGDGFTVEANKSVTILNAGKQGVFNNIITYPNPVVSNFGIHKDMHITWQATGTGRVVIQVNNMAGELISKFNAKLEDGAAVWNLQTVSGQDAASGLYIMILEGTKDTGEIQVKVMKVCVVRKD